MGYRPIKQKLDVLAAYIPLINMPTKAVYRTRVKNVLGYLANVTVATPQMIIEATNVEPHDIRRMITDKILTSSLNYNHNWLIATKSLNKRKDHYGFYRHRIGKYNRTVPIFHVKQTAKATLSHLASRRPWGLTGDEAEELLGRSCNRVLKQLVSEKSIQVRLYNGQRLYLNRYYKKADTQVKQRRACPRFKNDEDKDEKVGVITYEQFTEAFRAVLAEMDEQCSVSDDRLCAVLLMLNTNHTLRTMENWMAYNPRIQEATGMPWVVDHTTLCRAFNDVDEAFLKALFHQLVLKLHDDGIITGRFLAVDATHIYAFCNTRKDTNKHPVKGASWGEHHGKFYGYKVHIIIDSDSELPIAMVLSTGKDHDSLHFIPLFEQFNEQYDFDEIIATLADSAYDVKEFRNIVTDTTGGIFLPACNPRRSKVLKAMKLRVKKLFERFGDRIQSVEDGLRYLGQKFLTDYGVNTGTKQESKLIELIAERLHKPFRSAVERLFSRLKSLTSFEHPKSRRLKSVRKMVWWCLIGQLVHAKTAVDAGIPSAMRKRTALV